MYVNETRSDTREASEALRSTRKLSFSLTNKAGVFRDERKIDQGGDMFSIQLFQRCLIKVLNIDLWKCYLNYVRDTKGKLPSFRSAFFSRSVSSIVEKQRKQISASLRAAD